MVRKILNVDREEFVAWLRGTPKKVAVPSPPRNRATKTILTVMSRDVVVIPPALWPAKTGNELPSKLAAIKRAERAA